MKRWLLLLFASLVFGAVAGCGGGSSDRGTPSGALPNDQIPTDNAQPIVFAAATGPVSSQADANQRLLQRYLFQAFGPGVNAQGDLDIEPPVKAYTVPPGLIAQGTLIGTIDGESSSYRLPSSAYVFWVDPFPLMKKGHPSRIVYILANDGTILEQRVEFQPTVGSQSPLAFSSAQEANLIFQNSEYEITARALRMAADQLLAPILTREPEVLGQFADGGQVVGASLIAAEDISANNDANAARRLFRSMGGTNDNFFAVIDDPENDDPFPPTLDLALADAKAAAAGLGADDKFFLHISSHGTKSGKLLLGMTPIGLNSQGKPVYSLVTWQDLCRWLDQNIPAGNINLLLDTCYSGLAVCAFEEWADDTDKRVRVLAATDKTHQSFSSPFGTGYATACITRMLVDRINELKGNATAPTLEQVERAFFEFDLTKEHVLEKICDITDLAKSLDGQVRFNDLKKSQWEEITGVPTEGGFDSRPDPTPPTPTPTPTPGTDLTLTFDTVPTEGVAGEPLDPDITVSVRNGQGGLFTTTTPIELILRPTPGNSLPPGAALVGTTIRGTVNGVATFPNLNINQPGNFRIEARANEITAQEVADLLIRASGATPSQDQVIHVVDRAGRLVGVRTESGVEPFNRLDNNISNLTLALDGALARARTSAFFADLGANLVHNFLDIGNINPNPADQRRLTGVTSPSGVDYDNNNDRLFVGSTTGTVSIFDLASTLNGPVTADRQITAFPSIVIGVAYDALNDRLFVALDNGTIDVFDNASVANGTRNALVDRTISAAQMVNPRTLFLDPVNQRLFVAEASNPGAVLTFTNAGSANGLTVPDQVLTGGISNPFGIFVDLDLDFLYVTNIGTDTLTIYERASSVTGNVVPTFTIGGFDQPQGIVVAPRTE